MLEGASYGKTRVGGSTRGQPRRRRSRSSSLAARFGILVPGRAVPRDLRPSERGRYSPGSPLRGAPLLPGWSDAVRGGEACSGNVRASLRSGGLQPARCARAQYPHLGASRAGSIYRRGGTALGSRCLGGRPSPRPGGGTAAPSGETPGLAGGRGRARRAYPPLPHPPPARFARARLWRPGSHWSAHRFPDAGAPGIPCPQRPSSPGP